MAEFDIHEDKRRLERNLIRVKAADISNKNKSIILKFYENSVLQGMSKGRMVRYLTILIITAEALDKDFDKATQNDIKAFVMKIQEKDYSP